MKPLATKYDRYDEIASLVTPAGVDACYEMDQQTSYIFETSDKEGYLLLRLKASLNL